MKLNKTQKKQMFYLGVILLVIGVASIAQSFRLVGDPKYITLYPASPAPGESQYHIWYGVNEYGQNNYYVACDDADGPAFWETDIGYLGDAKAFIDDLNAGASTTPDGQDLVGYIVVSVTNSDGDRLTDALIEIDGLEDKWANTLGKATFYNVPPGVFSFTVSQDNYVDQISSVTVEAGKTATKTIKLDSVGGGGDNNNPPPDPNDPVVKVVLTAQASAGGQIIKPSQQGSLTRGYTVIDIEAKADPGYKLLYWLVNNEVYGQNTRRVPLGGEDTHIVAMFEPIDNGGGGNGGGGSNDTLPGSQVNMLYVLILLAGFALVALYFPKGK